MSRLYPVLLHGLSYRIVSLFKNGTQLVAIEAEDFVLCLAAIMTAVHIVFQALLSADFGHHLCFRLERRFRFREAAS